MYTVEVELFGSHIQNNFMKSSFLTKYEQKIVKISALNCATLQYFEAKFFFIKETSNIMICTFCQTLPAASKKYLYFAKIPAVLDGHTEYIR